MSVWRLTVPYRTHGATAATLVVLALAAGSSAFAQLPVLDMGGPQTIIVRNGSLLSSNNAGAEQIYRSGYLSGSALAAESNDTSDENRTTLFDIGKVGGYWTSQGANVGVQGHVTGQGDGGYGVVGSVGGYVNPDQSGIDAPVAWGALGGQVGMSTYAVISNGDQYSTTGTLWVNSDARLKQDIDEIHDALAIVRTLKPSTYEYRPELRDRGIAVPRSTQYGFIAQELEVALPSLVRDVTLPVRSTGQGASVPPNSGVQRDEKAVTYKAVQVLGLIPVLTKAIQELDTKYQAALHDATLENRVLRARLADLEARIDSLSPARKAAEAAPQRRREEAVTLASLSAPAPGSTPGR